MAYVPVEYEVSTASLIKERNYYAEELQKLQNTNETLRQKNHLLWMKLQKKRGCNNSWCGWCQRELDFLKDLYYEN